MSACTKQIESESLANFYYCTNPINYNSLTGVISAEVRDVSGYDHHLDLLNLYIDGPTSAGYRSPFPDDVEVISMAREVSTVLVCMNSEFAKLTGHDLTLACACLSKTIIDFTGCTSVRISAQNEMLDANAYIEMADKDFLFLDEYLPQS